METSKVDFLFGLPIYREKIDPTTYDKKKIIKTIEHNYKISKYRGRSSDQYLSSGWGNWHHAYGSVDKRFKTIDYTKLTYVYGETLKKFCANFLQLRKDHHIKFTTLNYTANRQHSYMDRHNHPNSDFAFVHYVQFPLGSSPIKFINDAKK